MAYSTSAQCTQSVTDDKPTNHFTSNCATTTASLSSCAIILDNGYYGGSVTCNSDTYTIVAATPCNTIDNAATVTCTDSSDQIVATCINGYSLENAVCVETVDLIADNAASKMERELSCRDYELAHIHIEKAIHFFQSALHKEIQCDHHDEHHDHHDHDDQHGHHDHDGHHDHHHDEHHDHDDHHDHDEHHDDHHERYGEYHDDDNNGHHDHPSQVTWGEGGWRTHASTAGGRWANWLRGPQNTLSFKTVDDMCQKAHKSCAFGHDVNSIGPRRLHTRHHHSATTTMPIARGLSKSVIDLSLKNIVKNICRIQDIERRTRDIKAGLVAWDTANEANSNKCTTDCDGCDKCILVGVRSSTDATVVNQMFCLDGNCKSGHTFSPFTAHILLNEVGASDSEIGNCIASGRRLRGTEEEVQQAKNEEEEAKHMFEKALESFQEAKNEEIEAKAQATMPHERPIRDIAQISSSSIIGIKSHMNKLQNHAGHATVIMPKVLEGLSTLQTLYNDIEPLYKTLNPSDHCPDDSYDELINWVNGFGDIITDVGDYINTRLDRFDKVLSGVGTPMMTRSCQPDI